LIVLLKHPHSERKKGKKEGWSGSPLTRPFRGGKREKEEGGERKKRTTCVFAARFPFSFPGEGKDGHIAGAVSAVASPEKSKRGKRGKAPRIPVPTFMPLFVSSSEKKEKGGGEEDSLTSVLLLFERKRKRKRTPVGFKTTLLLKKRERKKGRRRGGHHRARPLDAVPRKEKRKGEKRGSHDERRWVSGSYKRKEEEKTEKVTGRGFPYRILRIFSGEKEERKGRRRGEKGGEKPLILDDPTLRTTTRTNISTIKEEEGGRGEGRTGAVQPAGSPL